MATSLGKLWIQTSCIPGEGYTPPGYSDPRHTTYLFVWIYGISTFVGYLMLNPLV